VGEACILGEAVGRCQWGGRLLLVDVVFPSETEDLEADLDAWVGSMGEMAGAKMALHAESHVRQEFSTLDWIMEGLLSRAGFRIDEAEHGQASVTTYLCTKSR